MTAYIVSLTQYIHTCITFLVFLHRYFFCKNVATLKWHVEFHIHNAQSLFYLLLKLRRKLVSLKSVGRHTSTVAPSPAQVDIQLKHWQVILFARAAYYIHSHYNILFIYGRIRAMSDSFLPRWMFSRLCW